MKRFQGEQLPENARIALISNDALGNYVVVTPLAQLIRHHYPRATFHYFGGHRTAELWGAEPMFDKGFPLFGTPPDEAAKWIEAPYDWVINVDSLPWAQSFAAIAADGEGLVTGPCVSLDGRSPLDFELNDRGALWRDSDWTSPQIQDRHPFLTSAFIGEMFCRLAYFEGAVPSYRLTSVSPSIPLPDVLIGMSASLPEKLWPVENWLSLARSLHERGKTVGLLGAAPSNQRKFWQGCQGEDELVQSGLVTDLRGQLRLPEVVGALAQAQQVITLDNGILHLAAATKTPTVGLFRYGIHRLWAPPSSNIQVIHPSPECLVASIPVEAVLSHCHG